MNANDDSFLIKYKQAGFSDKAIAQKLGKTVKQVETRWADMVAQAARLPVAGYDALADQFQTLCGQYQLLGESLKIIAMGLGNPAPLDEIREEITTDPEKTLVNITSRFIILRPFVSVDPAESLSQSLSQVQKEN